MKKVYEKCGGEEIAFVVRREFLPALWAPARLYIPSIQHRYFVKVIK